MQITLQDKNGRTLQTVQADDQQELFELPISREILVSAGDTLVIGFRQPVLDIQGYWTSELYRPKMELPWVLTLNSAAQREMPFLCWYNMSGTNRASFGLTNVTDDAFLRSKMSQSDSDFDLTWTICLSPETEPFVFFADRRPLPFYETVQAFRKRILPENPAFPAKAWEPVYCTWYAFHGAYTIPELEKNAAAAKEMGFGTFILDDGWSYDVSKRLNTATLSEWYSDIGNWTVSEKKLPDFQTHVNRVKAMGLNYVLWCSPFLIGHHSEIYRILKERGSIMDESDDGSAVCDPADPVFREYVHTRIEKTFRQYGFDGLKIDFVDFVHPDPKRPRGRTALACVKDLVSRVRAVRPDAILEFRQHYCTPAMLPYATNFRANDVPFDFLENLHRCCMLRMILGDGVPVHADPVSFHPEESSVNVARHAISSLAGVPMISADLSKLPAKHAAILKRFVTLYREHQETFRKGHWTVHYEFGHVTSVSVETPEEKILTIVAGIPALPADKRCIVMNLGTETFSLPGMAMDCEGNAADRLFPGGILFSEKA